MPLSLVFDRCFLNPVYQEENLLIQRSISFSESARFAAAGMCSQRRSHRHKQPARFTRYQGKSIDSVELHGAIVLGIDDDGERADAKAVGADRGIEDQSSPQFPSLKTGRPLPPPFRPRDEASQLCAGK